MAVNWLDIIIILMLLIATVMGLRRGLIQTVLPLGGIMLGIVLAGLFYDSMANWLSTWLDSPSQAKIAGFVIIFSVVVAVVMVIAWLLSGFFKLMLLGWVDKLGGAFFGLAIGILASSAVLAVIAKFPFSSVEGTVRGSGVAAFFLDHFPLVLGLLPREFDNVHQFFG
jgi:membrane protein required for colicin V production